MPEVSRAKLIAPFESALPEPISGIVVVVPDPGGGFQNTETNAPGIGVLPLALSSSIESVVDGAL